MRLARLSQRRLRALKQAPPRTYPLAASMILTVSTITTTITAEKNARSRRAFR